MRTRIISFHNGNLNPELLKAQKAVFDFFKIPLEQILVNVPHPEAIDLFLECEDWDNVFIFDADCVPLYANVVKDGLEMIESDNAVYGAVQRASHIPNSKNYISPAFMVLSKKVWNKLGRPSFKATSRGDVAEEISYAARALGVELVYIDITEVETPLWPLEDGRKFGYGTNFGNIVYHAFESNANHQSTANFIAKCRDIIWSSLTEHK